MQGRLNRRVGARFHAAAVRVRANHANHGRVGDSGNFFGLGKKLLTEFQPEIHTVANDDRHSQNV
jgi:hypothetical protein